ncbi:MAG: hypothetical protein LJE69_15365 [Thiohalocapsa sp.]|jgi:hypothetical protein|uniref:hypothetical protein n=1 Tax=Thiohalocapsa sp. TaxID=2497641 RepID=UPI0025F00AEB|nr:hypothetical protein [Thiohalocapsa sp.]MCG6942618.1 hypothetical protein [Thiohalocapsa sp.]
MKHQAIPAAILTLCLGLAPTVGVQAQPDLQTHPIKAMGARTTLEGRVVVVNADTRMMTVRTPDGTFEVLRIPPEVSRLDRVRIGNQVQLTETTAALITLQTGRDAGAMGRQATTHVERKPGSNRPAGTLQNQVRLLGQIVGVDPSAGTVEIRGPHQTRTLELEDKAALSRLKVGDGVVLTLWHTMTGEITVR